VGDDLSPSLAVVASYVLANSDKVALLSVDEISLACNVSKATVVRFCRALGYDGLRSLKQSLIADQMRMSYQPNVRKVSAQINSETAHNSRVTLEAIANSLISTARLIDSKAFEAVVKLMARAELIMWYGVGDSGFLALSGNHRCQINGLNSKATYYPEDMKAFARQSGPADVLVCISRSGRTPSMLAPVRYFEANSPAKIVVITGDPGSPITKVADFTLVSAPIDLYVAEQRTSLQAVQMSVIDSLIAGLLFTRFGEVRCTGTEPERSISMNQTEDPQVNAQ
jgi:RpiR family carbohydrate utilization transcriptional regulator